MGFDEYNEKNRGRAAAPYVTQRGAEQIEQFGRDMANGLQQIDSINDQVFAAATFLGDVVVAGAVLANPALAPAGALVDEVLGGLKDAVDGDGKFDKTVIARIIEKASALDVKEDSSDSPQNSDNASTPHSSS
ncbi:hypothetical protein IT570_03545 [Candidatus Sumerlaeota bacterium]|nr:hypothetical protein [Candidatus Sumerlaeota bacterium]